MTVIEMNELLRLFNYRHLPEPYQEVSKQFYDLAHRLAQTLPRNRELTKALDRLLEAKDAAVRSAV